MRYNAKQLPSGQEDEIIDVEAKDIVSPGDFGWILFVPIIAALGYFVFEILKMLWIVFSGLFVCVFLGC